jgi:hypothetical protein
LGGPRPCPRTRRFVLKTVIVGLCALVLATQAVAVAKGEASAVAVATPSTGAKTTTPALSLDTRLERKHRSIVRFFANHRTLLNSVEHRTAARTALRRAERRLARTVKNIAGIRRVLRRREARRLATAPPKVVICAVFGRRYCGQALSVAGCESRHRTTARNGQYLGLFQMGSSERRLFGHGSTARQQAIAAHKYFVLSGRDWSPWSCKPTYAY